MQYGQGYFGFAVGEAIESGEPAPPSGTQHGRTTSRDASGHEVDVGCMCTTEWLARYRLTHDHLDPSRINNRIWLCCYR